METVDAIRMRRGKPLHIEPIMHFDMERLLLHIFALWIIFKRGALITDGPGTEESHDRKANLTAPLSLNKPEIISWELDGHYLIVNWQHSDPKQLLHGYYVALCRSAKTECKDLDFVKFDRGLRSGRVVGLAPEATYRVEVIAYNAEEHISSDPVTVNTKKLQFLLAKNLSVSLVTCCHAVFQWNHEPHSNVHDVKFLLQCTGRREYVDLHKKIVEEESRFDHLSPSTSKQTEIFFAKNMDPNTRYLCTISSVAGTIQSPPSQQITFKTHPGNPSTPPTPKISVVGKDNVFTASIYPTDERFGPISHYMLIAVPVSKSKNDPLTAPYQPIIPVTHLLEKALSSKTVATVSQPLPFIVSTFAPDDLPVNFDFGYEWSSVFKQKTYYSVVLVGFTRSMKANLFHSFSALSNPVFITEDLVEAWLKKQKPVAKKFTVIIVSCIFSVVILFTIAFLILFISNYCYAKKKDAVAYKFAISDTDSSEEEIFSKGKSQHEERLLSEKHNRPMSSKAVEKIEGRTDNQESSREPRVSLPERSPNVSHAEWAVENMSRRSPAFRDMLQKHPEALDEMNELMTKVGQKWEMDVTKAVSTVKIKASDHRMHSTHKRQSSSESSFSEPIYSNESRTLPPPVPPRLQSYRQDYNLQQEYQQEYQGYPQEYSRRYVPNHQSHIHQNHRQGYSHHGHRHSHSAYRDRRHYKNPVESEHFEDSMSDVDLT